MDHAIDENNVHVRDVIEQMMLERKGPQTRQDEMLEQRERDGQ